MKVLKFSEFGRSEEELALEIIENISNSLINEKFMDNDIIKSFLSKLSKDIGFNISLVTTFGTGIGFMIPIVKKLIENSNLSIELTDQNIILLCITILSITYLEETKNRTGEEINKEGEKSLVSRKDAQTMLAELKMRGIGNGIVKKFVTIFKSIGDFFKILFKGTPYVVNGLFDMFAYTAIMLPCMNALNSYVGKYDMNIDNIVGNLLSIGAATGALITKQGVNWLMNKLRNILKSKNIKLPKKEDDDIIINPYDMIDIEIEKDSNSELIKEHD